ncbi:hypothetical protein, partial [Shewanella chilikensis]|uniref:hypothetical protein n=1 Tax=Shewanella chilikensis TaxID=558541 RepID=UPI001F3772B0
SDKIDLSINICRLKKPSQIIKLKEPIEYYDKEITSIGIRCIIEDEDSTNCYGLNISDLL